MKAFFFFFFFFTPSQTVWLYPGEQMKEKKMKKEGGKKIKKIIM